MLTEGRWRRGGITRALIRRGGKRSNGPLISAFTRTGANDMEGTLANTGSLRRLSLLGVVLMTLGGALAACGDNDNTAENTGESTGTTATTGTTGNTTGTATGTTGEAATGATGTTDTTGTGTESTGQTGSSTTTTTTQ